MRRAVFTGATLLVAMFCSSAWADLAGEFAGFTYVNEIGVSGLQSSNGATKVPTSIFTLDTDRVSYPSGVGTVPSPGGSEGKYFDQGVLGVKVENGNLTVKLAGGMNPTTGYWSSAWNSRYGQGDVFLTVETSSEVLNYALLSQWGDNVHLGKYTESYYNQAQSFHSSYAGYLVGLASADVVLTSGTGAYVPGSSTSPDGLDYRIFAQSGSIVGDANLQTSSLYEGQMWYLQTWTVALEQLSDDSILGIGLHAATSCSNDQIALETQVVPLPAAAVLGMLGLSVAGWRLRKREQ